MLPGFWGTPLHACPALRPRWVDLLLPSPEPVDAAFRFSDTVGHHENRTFEAQSRSPHARCLRFTTRVTPTPCKTRYQSVG